MRNCPRIFSGGKRDDREIVKSSYGTLHEPLPDGFHISTDTEDALSGQSTVAKTVAHLASPLFLHVDGGQGQCLLKGFSD